MHEVILFAAIATVICIMLYSVLGKSVGRGPEDDGNLPGFLSGDTPEAPKVVAPVIDAAAPPGIAAIMKLDGAFSLNQFLNGARMAYPMILDAFADGDKAQLESLLIPDVYQVYAEAIDAREAKGLRQITDLARLIHHEVVSAQTSDKIMEISVRYKAELASALVDAAGTVIEGDPDTLSVISEIWTYTRKAGDADPNWKLSDVAPSEGDMLEADPSPDTKS